MPKSQEERLAPFHDARHAVEIAKGDVVKLTKRRVRALLKPMKGSLPRRFVVSHWNTDPNGSPIGVFRMLELTPGGRLFEHDMRFMGPVDDPQITRAAPLPEPREVYHCLAGDYEWLQRGEVIILGIAHIGELIARGERIPHSSEVRLFKEPVALRISEEPLVHYGTPAFGG